ncbi:MAG: DUF58 domain-containing protein [Bacteroidales bacterium]|nr:DUF58 domain-containing protein [Bacteroidales bacterium]MBP5680628.1 DUF58 domain-containing protein [Bacteroidales bacterium]
MDTTELIKKVRQIEIKSRGLSANIFAGSYKTAFRGHGMSFAEVREYQYGDDVRDIDWNVTARQNKPHIKIFEEERELTVMLLIDVSGSREFGTISRTKQEQITEIAATLAFSTISNNDKIGVVFFSDRIEKYIPPQKGKKHVLAIISEMLKFQPVQRGTDLNKAIQYVSNAQKKRCTTFLISDFCDTKNYQQALTIASTKHDMVAIQVYDPREQELPDVGLMHVCDAETGEDRWVDTSSSRVREAYAQWWQQMQAKKQEAFLHSQVDSVSVSTDEDFVPALLALFKKRS